MQKNILLGIIVFLLLVAFIPPVIAGDMDPVGSANLSVIVTPPLNGNQFYTGITVLPSFLPRQRRQLTNG